LPGFLAWFSCLVFLAGFLGLFPRFGRSTGNDHGRLVFRAGGRIPSLSHNRNTRVADLTEAESEPLARNIRTALMGAVIVLKGKIEWGNIA
jgi:hypothetical protein